MRILLVVQRIIKMKALILLCIKLDDLDTTPMIYC